MSTTTKNGRRTTPMAIDRDIIEESVEAVCTAIRKGLWEIGSAVGHEPGTIEFIGMQMRDNLPNLIAAIENVADNKVEIRQSRQLRLWMALV